MAVRLEKAFGGAAQLWLQMQSNYDLAQVRKREPEKKRRRIGFLRRLVAGI
jgi:plasmid maintenance system antidote protein VapI